jgi:hypothetical protein
MARNYSINNGGFHIHLLHIPTLIVLFILYYIYTRYYNIECKCNKKENFTPGLRGMYRPYLREARVVSEGFYGDSTNNVDHLFRKFGLY